MKARLERASLLFAVFVSGAVLLGVEIAASRVVAPFFGNSLYVWGALIGVVLTGLSVGYWVGGTLADRIPSIRLLLSVMSLGALLVLAIPFVDEWTMRRVVDVDFGARMNPLVAAVVLFGPMSVVLAAVTPVAVRIAANSVLTLGRTAGRLFAVSTFGSIVGTFATAFVLIPELGTNQLLALAAAVLLGGTALVAGARALPLAAGATLAAAVGALLLSGSLAPREGGRLSAAAAQNFSPVYRLQEDRIASTADYAAEGFRVRFRKNSAYHAIAVVEDDESRYLRFDSSFQSAMQLAEPFVSPFAYLDYLSLAMAYRPSAENMLVVGLGGGSAPKRFWRDFPELEVHAVELDPEVVNVAYRWFGLPRDERLGVTVEDGRRFLQVNERRWDVIVLDAYYSDSLPFHLTTREFLELARERLNPGGVVVANIIGSVSGPGSRLFRAFYRTYRQVFPSIAVYPVDLVGDPESIRNIIVVASEAALPQPEFVRQRWQDVLEEHPQAPNLEQVWTSVWDRFVPTGDVPVLTDDYAPTDALLVVD